MRDTKLADSNARKARMQAMDRERANKVPPTDIEQANRNKDVGILSKAQAQLDEELDDVKHMNQMVLYSKVVTIRDKQLQENKLLEQEWLEEQKKLDLMMEIERLKALKVAEEREIVRT
jgi:ribosomal protein L11 methylase PrmA